MDRTNAEFIEGSEFSETSLGAVGVHVDVGSEMDIGCDGNNTGNVVGVDVGKEVLDLELSSEDGRVFLSKSIAIAVSSGNNTERVMGRDDLPSGGGFRKSALEPFELFRAHHIKKSGIRVSWVGATVGSVIGEEDLEVLSESLASVDLVTFLNRVELVECLETVAVKKIGFGSLFVFGSSKDFTRVPVIGDLVIIPLNENRDVGKEILHLVVTKVVLPVGSELVQRNGIEVLGRIVGPVTTTHGFRDSLDSGDGTVGVDLIFIKQETKER